MAIKSVKDYLFSKLFFPKVITIDKPGIIYNFVDRKFGSPAAKKRVVMFFEDIIVNLQLETIKKIGRTKTGDLWYKIGKDSITNYMLSANIKKIPLPLLPLIIEYLFSTFRSAGMSCAEKINYDPKKQSLTLSGKDNMICRKTKIGEFHAGVVSGIMSSILKKNVEAITECENCPNECIIICNKKIMKRYIPGISKLKPLDHFKELNIPKDISKFKEFESFSSLFKFKKIRLDKNGKLHFMGETIVASPCEFPEIVSSNYQELGKKNTFRKGVIGGAEKLLINLINKGGGLIKNKLDLITLIYTGLGYGIPHYKKKNHQIIFDLLQPPITRFGFLFNALVLNGFLNVIFDKIKINLEEMTLKKDKYPIVTITYSIKSKKNSSSNI